MAEQDDIHYDVGLDVSEPLQALEQLSRRLDKFDENLIHSVGTVQNQMKKAASQYVAYIRNMETQLKELQKQGADTSKQQAFLANARARQTSAGETARRDYASGTSEQRSRMAAVNREIAEIRSSQEALMNRISKEILNTTLDSIRTTRAQVEARIKEEQFAARRMVDRTRDPTMRAREADATFRDSEFLKSVGHQAVTGRRADTRRSIEKIEDSIGVYQANIAEATFRSTQRILNASEDEIRNRTSRAELRRYRNRTWNPADETVLADRAAEDRAYRARNGDAAAGLRKTRERMDLNGGADFMAMQAGLLNNYMLIGGTYGAGAFLGNFVVQLDKQFKEFQAITDTTNASMETMENRLLSVSEKTKFTALEIAEAATIMGQAGLSADQVATSIEPISMLATAAGTGLKDAVDVVTSTLNIFNLQTSEAGHIADVYTAALNRSKLSLDQLTVSLQYAGNTAATAGVGYNELTASIGALANAGIRSGSTMGTGIRQVLVDLMNPSEKLIAELEKVGLTLADVNVEANGLTGVITNLTQAGFGTEEAFAGFEVRAAAAFTALASNVDTITNLRQSFLLNTAAAKANETQMEALANTWAKFGSNAGALAYTAFRPTVSLLQEVVDGIADMMGVARDADGAMRILGTTISSLAIAWATVKIGGIVVGLARMAAGAQAASTAVGILFNVLRLSPVGIGIMGATAAATAYMAWADSASAAADQLDRLDTQINTISGNVTESQNRIQSIVDTIDDLTKKRESLEKVGNEGLRATRAMEIVSTFSELADKVDTSKASVNDLIEALRNLKGELTGNMPAQFELMVANLDAKIKELQGTIAEQLTTNGKADLGNFVSDYLPDLQQGTGIASVFGAEQDFASMGDQVGTMLGEAAAKVFVAIASGEELGGFEAAGLRDRLKTAQRNTATELSTLQLKSNPSGQDLERIDALQRNNEALEQLIKLFEPLAGNFINLEATRNERELALKNQRRADLQARPGYQALSNQTDDLSSFTTEGLRSITRAMGADGKGLDTQEVADRLKALDDAFQAKLKQIDDDAAKLAEEFAAESGMDVADVNEMLNTADFRTRIATIRNQLAAEGKSSEEQVKEITAFLKKGEKASIERQIDVQLKRLTKATTEEEVDLIKGYINRLQTQLSAVNAEIRKADVAKEIDQSPSARKIAAEQAAQDEQEAAEEIERQILERRGEIYKRQAEEQENQARTELRTIEDEMRLLLGQMNGNATVEMIKGIKKKMDALAARAKILAGQIAAIDVGQDFIPQTGSGVIDEGKNAFSGGQASPVSTTDVKSQMWNYWAEKGLPSHQIAAILGTGEAESGFRPTIVNSIGATGLLQMLSPERKAGLMRHTKGDLTNVKAQMDWTWEEFQGSENNAYKQLRASKNTREAIAAMMNYERPDGWKPGNPWATHDAQARLEYTNAHLQSFGGRPATPVGEQQDTAIETAATDNLGNVRQNQADFDKKNAQLERARAAKSATAAGKAIEAEINTLMTQSSKVSSPDALKSLLDQVRAKWQDVMVKETEAFKAKNEGSENFAEDLENFRKGLDAKLNQDVVQLLDRYQSVIEQDVPEKLKVARAQLESMQDPANTGKFTDLEIQRQETNVALLEREAITTRLNALEQFRALLTQELTAAEANYGSTSEQANAIRARQAELERSVGDLRITSTAQAEAAARAEYGLGQAIDAANTAWMQRNGLMDASGNLTSGAQQFGEAWGQVLDGLTSGFATLFTNLANGQMTAAEAFQQFGLTVLQMLTEIIAKSLALQLVQSLLGAGGSGGAGGFFGMLFGGAGAATGQIVPGVTRAANGEMITGGSPFRDSVLRNVQPGEAILRTSAVNAIGRDAVTKMNALGNRSLDGGMPKLEQPAPVQAPPTNVWILPPEEQPQMGPNDIVAVITDDMRRRGSTRQLIKAIAGGQM